MCSTQNFDEWPCQECIIDGPNIARLCAGNTTSYSGTASPSGGYGVGGNQGRGMDPGGPSSMYKFDPSQGGLNPTDNDTPTGFDGFSSYVQPYSRTPNLPTEYSTVPSQRMAQGNESLHEQIDDDERRRREWDERVADPEELRIFEELERQNT